VNNSKPTAEGLEALGITGTERASVLDFIESWDSHGGPLLFVGSGMSRFEARRKPGISNSVKIEDWGQLTRGLALALTGGDSDLDGTFPTDHLGVAQAYSDKNGRRRLIDKIELAVPYKSFDPGPGHRAICQFRWASIVTTNYDDFLERAFDDAGHRWCRIVNDVDLNRRRAQDSLEIIKMHGCLLESPGSIVISGADYRDYEADRSFLTSKVRLLLYQHPTLFLGFSLTDPNVTEMLCWVRKRGGGYILPSLALVHDQPTDEQRGYWAERKIHLVLLPHGQTVAGFLDALHLAWSKSKAPPELPSRSSRIAELKTALDSRTDGWLDVVASLVADIVSAGTARDQSDAAHRVLYGAVHKLNTPQVEAIVLSLEPNVRRALLLTAYRHGIVYGGGSTGINVEEVLLGDEQLSADERCEVLLLQAERMEARGDATNAKRALGMARDLRADAPWATEIQCRLRRLLHRIGDQSLITSALLAPLEGADAFAYTRRGADLLMTQGRVAALDWYRRAQEVARNADEKTAALLGIQACGEPGEIANLSEIDAQWTAIREAVRPRVDHFHELESKAGQELLRGFREGAKEAGAEASRALEHLELALADADDMGWPRSPSPNFTGPADATAYTAVGLLLREDAAPEEIKRALTLFVERGLLQPHRRVRIEALDGLLAAPWATEWAREFLLQRDEATYMRRSRDLLTSALLPTLADVRIVEHLERVVKLPELSNASWHETSQSELHLNLLQRHYHAIPRDGALIAVRLLTEVFANEDMARLRYTEWAWLPIWDWTKSGSIDPQSVEIQSLIETLVDFYAGTEKFDGLASRRALRLLDELRTAGAIASQHVDTLTATLDRAIDRGLELDDGVSDVLALVRARQELRACEVPTRLIEAYSGMYARLRNSTVAGTWMNLLDTVGQHLPPEDKRLVMESIDDYVNLTLQPNNVHLLGPFPDWAATAIHQGVKGGVLTPAQGWERLQNLARVYPECIAFALDMPGADVRAAQKILLAALARGRVDDGAVLRWCVWQPQSSAPSPELEGALLPRLLSTNAEERRHAYWSLGWLERNGVLSREGEGELCRSILEYGVTDPVWKPRSAAVVAAAEVSPSLSEQQLDTIVQDAEADPMAGVRRAGGFLRGARTRGLLRRSRRP